MEKDFQKRIEANIHAEKYGDPNDAANETFLTDVQAYITVHAHLNMKQAKILLRKACIEREGCSQLTVLGYVIELCRLFAAVDDAKIDRKLEVRVADTHRSCGSCCATNYETIGMAMCGEIRTDRLYEVVVGNMCVCMCADCIKAMTNALDVLMAQNGGADNE